MASASLPKRKRGRPSKADKILYDADMAQLTEVESTLQLLPALYEKIKSIALSDHRQQLSAAKLLLDRFEAHVDRMHKEEDAEIAEQNKEHPPKKQEDPDLDNITPQIQWEYVSDELQ